MSSPSPSPPMVRTTARLARSRRPQLAALAVLLLLASLARGRAPAAATRAEQLPSTPQVGAYLPLAVRAADVKRLRAAPTVLPTDTGAAPTAVPTDIGTATPVATITATAVASLTPTTISTASATATTIQPSPTPSSAATAEPTATSTAVVTATPTPAATVAPDCGAVPTLADGRTPLREVYIAPDGDDGAGDGSPERPFATLGRAAREVRPGTALRLRPGTYPGGTFLSDVRGTADAPIWIGGVPSAARPVIDAGGQGEGLHLVRPSYVVLHDLEVHGARHNGVNIDDGGAYDDPIAAHHVLVRDVSIHDVGGDGNQDCLKLSGLDHFWVLDSQFARCGGGGSGSGVDLVGDHHGVIARNSFEQLSANAVQAKGGTADVEIRWNRMTDAGHRAVNMGGSTGFTYFRPPLDPDGVNAEARDVRVVANVIVGGVTPFAFVGCVECLAAHNTVVDPERWLLRILQETTSREGFTFAPVRDGQVVNNLFTFSRQQLARDVNVGPNTAPETFRVQRNLFYAHDAPERSAPQLPGQVVGSIVGQDPQLTDDYAIGPDSPAVGAGAPLAGVRGDITGRCYDSAAPSIGAYAAP